MGRLTEIAHFYDPEEAYCARAYLAARGVDALFQNEHHLTVAPWLRIALGGYRLLVSDENADAAARLLREISTDGRKDQFEDDQERSRKTKLSKERRLQTWIWLPVAFAAGVPFIPLRRTRWIRAFELIALASFYGWLIWSWSGWFIRW